MKLEEYFHEWLKVIDLQELYKAVNQINAIYNKDKCEPAYSDIFKAFHITPYNKLCMVWLLQDPYPQTNVSTGIALGNKIDKDPLSPSLQVIKEAVIDFEVPHNLVTFDPSLEEWSSQGILLLNSALTVEVNKPTSHAYIWRPFISSLLRNLSALNPGLVYVLWGAEAKTFKSCISKGNIIYSMPHPAYYARTSTKIPHSFFTELTNVIDYHFDRKIKWFTEETFENEE